MKEETLQSSLLIHQEYEGSEQIIISDKLVKSYQEMKKNMNRRKSGENSNKEEEKDSQELNPSLENEVMSIEQFYHGKKVKLNNTEIQKNNEASRIKIQKEKSRNTQEMEIEHKK